MSEELDQLQEMFIDSCEHRPSSHSIKRFFTHSSNHIFWLCTPDRSTTTIRNQLFNRPCNKLQKLR